jgi:hypothetical protein
MQVENAMQRLRKQVQAAVIEACENVMSDQELFGTCINCRYFKEDVEFCTLANARPPARIIAFGCPSYQEVQAVEIVPAPKIVPKMCWDDMDDDIPF